MKRRHFLEAFSVALGSTRTRSMFLGSTATYASREAVASREAGSSPRIAASAAEADWIARSTAPGVLWAHDFREDAEFHTFHKGSSAPNDGSLSTNPPPHPYHATLVPTPFGRSRAIRSRARGTPLTRDVPAAAKGDIQVLHVADITEIIEPWDGEYRLRLGTTELVMIQSVDVANSTVTVKRGVEGSTGMRSAGTTIGSGPNGRWIRPTASIVAGENGKSVDDIGITNGTARKARSFTTHSSFREGYFGHKSYWDPAHGDALYADWTPTYGRDRSERPDAFEGDEFYLQFRGRIPWDSIKLGQLGPKMIYIQNCTGSGDQQFYWRMGPVHRNKVPDEWPHGPNYGKGLLGATCWGDSRAPFGPTLSMPQGGYLTSIRKNWTGLPDEIFWLQHPDDFPAARYYDRHIPRMWSFPGDKWVTYLLHFKMGRHSKEVGAVGQLVRQTQARPYSDKSTEIIYLDDVSAFPDPSPKYFVHTGRSNNRFVHEHMMVEAVDRVNNTLTVSRNYRRDKGTANDDLILPKGTDIRGQDTLLYWEVGSAIVWGYYDQFPRRSWGAWGYKKENDPRLGRRETLVEIFAAVEGETEYKKITSYDKFAWLYSDNAGGGGYLYNPPGLNSIELSLYMNDYIGSGSVPPGKESQWVDYTQAILSRTFIPVPLV